MRRTQAPYDDTWAVAHIREVWEWAVAQDRHFVAYLLGMAILAFERDQGDGKFKPPPAREPAPSSAPTKRK